MNRSSVSILEARGIQWKSAEAGIEARGTSRVQPMWKSVEVDMEVCVKARGSRWEPMEAHTEARGSVYGSS